MNVFLAKLGKFGQNILCASNKWPAPAPMFMYKRHTMTAMHFYRCWTQTRKDQGLIEKQYKAVIMKF